MKKNIAILLCSTLLFTGCYTGRMGGDPAAVSAGASIGGVLGSIIGDRAGGFHGSQFGALVGTVTGAAIGNVATTPKQQYATASTPVTYVEVENLRFIDANRNQRIDAGEECKLVFEVVNNGSTPAYNVTPVVEETSGMKHLAISSSTQISYMPAGNRVRYTVTLRADNRLRTGQASLRVYVTESNGGVSDIHSFTLPTQRR